MTYTNLKNTFVARITFKVNLQISAKYIVVQNMPEAKKEILENMEETKATLGLKALSVLRYDLFSTGSYVFFLYLHFCLT